MATNTIKIKETDSSYIGKEFFPVEPGSVEIMETGKTTATTYMHGGVYAHIDDYSNHIATIKWNTKFESEAKKDYLYKLFMNNTQIAVKIGDKVYTNAVLQSFPNIKLQEFVSIEFKAPAKPF